MSKRVGFIGLGSQRAPMARRIVESGYPLTIWARRSDTTASFADTTATVASTPADVGAASDVVGICVVGDADVEDVVLRPDGVLAGMSAGGIVAIHATSHPSTCLGIAERAAERNVSVVDAPVSGGGGAAAERTLLVMAGGSDDAVARCRPIFETFANPVIHLGPVGSGQTAKLVNNLVFTAQIAIALETFSFADHLHMDRSALAEVLAHASGGSRAATILAGSGFDLAGLRQAASLLHKDLDLALDLARGQGVSEPDLVAGLARHAVARLEHPDLV